MRSFFYLFIFMLPFLSHAQIKLKWNGSVDYDFISGHLIARMGLEYEQKLDIDKSFSIEVNQYTLDYVYAFRDTNSTLLLSKDEYFENILEGQKNDFKSQTNYINSIFKIIKVNIGGNFYLTPDIYLSGRVGLNFLYRGSYFAYQNDIIDNFEEVELFSGIYNQQINKQFFSTYDIQINKILFRRFEFGLGATFSPAHFYASDETPKEVYILHLDALYFFTTNASLKIYFKKFNTKKI